MRAQKVIDLTGLKPVGVKKRIRTEIIGDYGHIAYVIYCLECDGLGLKLDSTTCTDCQGRGVWIDDETGEQD